MNAGIPEGRLNHVALHNAWVFLHCSKGYGNISHPRSLQDRFAGAAGTGTPIASFPGSDYPWRILCSAGELQQYINVISASIDYGNFKSAIAINDGQQKKPSAYHHIREEMVEWQRGQGRPVRE